MIPLEHNWIIEFQDRIIEWGNNNKKEYQWRESNNPYEVLVSEYMLHRTQAKQVVPVFSEFIRKYPKLSDIIESDEKEVLSVLKPLGLRWRQVLMIKGLKELYSKYGEIPADYKKLISIKGIGQYIGGATDCFINNNPIPLVDSNIVRVVGRAAGIDISGEARRRKEIKEAIKKIINKITNVRAFYYSIIDLAHNLCKIKSPVCMECPLLNLNCEYHRLKSL